MREFPRPVDETATGVSARSPDEASRDVTWEVMSKHINDLIILSDLDGKIFYASPSCARFGYAQLDLVGRRAADFLHPEDLDYDPEDLARLNSQERGLRSGRERRFRCKDGSWVWLEGSPSALDGAPGVPVARLNVFRDVTERRAVRDSLAQQAKRATQAEAVAGLGYWRLDALTQEITWSEQMFKVYGLPQGDEPPLAAAMAMTHPDDVAQTAMRLARATEHAEGWPDVVTRIVRPDGQVRHLHGRGVCEVDAAGRVTAVIGTLVDVTDAHLAQEAIVESERRYRLLAENTTDMISQTATDGRMIYLSPSVERMTGYSIAELLPRQMREFVHPDDLAGFLAFYGALISGRREGGCPVRYRVRRQDGSWLWLESNPRLVASTLPGEAATIIDVSRDVTEQEALKVKLSDAVAEAERLAAVKGEFLANMSHEIRTPLTAVLGFADLLDERRDLDAAAQSQVRRISGASRALLAVVNDVLDFSKLEAGEVTIRRRPSLAERAAREVLEMFDLQAQAKGVDLVFEAAADLPQCLILDEDRLRQILINLVSNAVKFTDQGRVSLSLGYVDGALFAEVSDTGPGIAAEARAKLFQRFSQVDGSSTRRTGGTGLGLAICLGLAEAMGGTVAVTSHLGRGSTFRLVLPALRGSDADGAIGSAKDFEQLCGLRVLVADDNAINRELARAILEPAGVEVSEARDGHEAVNAAQRLPFDAILMDLRMPCLDGCEALNTIRRESGPNQHMPILAFSADGTMDAGQAELAGFQGIVRKPTSASALLRALLTAVYPDATPDCEISHVAA